MNRHSPFRPRGGPASGRHKESSAKAHLSRPSPLHRVSAHSRQPHHRSAYRRQGVSWDIIAATASGIVVLGVLSFLIVRAMSAPRLPLTPTDVADSSPSPSAGSGEPSSTVLESRSKQGATPAPPLDAVPVPALFDLHSLQQLMLTLINKDRAVAGLRPVAWDQTATLVAQVHAEEMASFGYMSHWDLSGHGPPYRYSQVGGLDTIQENVWMYWYRFGDGRPAQIENWEEVIRQAEANLMDSPGHRANILTPEHTHIGIGIAYNPQSGDVRLDQLFVNRYVQIMPVPTQATLGQQIMLQGWLEPKVSNPLLNLAYEPFPKPMSVTDLNRTSIYMSQAEIYDSASLEVSGDGRFQHEVTLDKGGQPGLFYIRIWVNSEYGNILANEVVIEVR